MNPFIELPALPLLYSYATDEVLLLCLNPKPKMGSCISKCMPNKPSIELEEFDRTEDKLVISQAPKTPNIPVCNKVSPLPLSLTASSSSSVSSFTCTASNTISSCSSLSSSSSVLSSKDRSFSNEFLWACVKENPHIIRINSIKEASLALPTTKPYARKPESPVNNKALVAPVMQSIPHTPKKRGRSSSPINTLARQKSSRKDSADQRPICSALLGRTLRSPSPSRRFSAGDNGRGILASTPKGNCSKRHHSSKVTPVNFTNSVSSSLPKESFTAASLITNNNNSNAVRPYSRNRETCIHRISSKIDEMAVGAALFSQQDGDSIPMEDIDNPLISLDCFIFL